MWTPQGACFRTASRSSVAPSRFYTMRAAYARHGLEVNAKRSHSREFDVVLWEAQSDGISGYLRAAIPRSMALTCLTVQVACLGYSINSLLQVLAGPWIAILVYRRRLMSLLQCVVDGIKGKRGGDIAGRPPELRTKLLTKSDRSIRRAFRSTGPARPIGGLRRRFGGLPVAELRCTKACP